jgi:hypothetical protein
LRAATQAGCTDHPDWPLAAATGAELDGNCVFAFGGVARSPVNDDVWVHVTAIVVVVESCGSGYLITLSGRCTLDSAAQPLLHA